MSEFLFNLIQTAKMNLGNEIRELQFHYKEIIIALELIFLAVMQKTIATTM